MIEKSRLAFLLGVHRASIILEKGYRWVGYQRCINILDAKENWGAFFNMHCDFLHKRCVFTVFDMLVDEL